MPADWEQAFETCLAHAKPAEREHYLEMLADTGALLRPAVASPKTPLVHATRDELDALVRVASLDEAIALVRDARARLRPENLEALVARAKILAGTGERRLSEALLARTPVRVQVAPLFLEATQEQRAALIVAAQRAELGRNAPAPRFDIETASRLEYAALTGEAAEFSGALAEALAVEPELAWRIVEDRGGEPLSLALAALGAPRDLAVRIITALDMREGDAFRRIHAFAKLADRVSAPVARRLVDAISDRPQAAASAPLLPATSREAANPSPFLRREASERRARITPERTVRQALNSRRP